MILGTELVFNICPQHWRLWKSAGVEIELQSTFSYKLAYSVDSVIGPCAANDYISDFTFSLKLFTYDHLCCFSKAEFDPDFKTVLPVLVHAGLTCSVILNVRIWEFQGI